MHFHKHAWPFANVHHDPPSILHRAYMQGSNVVLSFSRSTTTMTLQEGASYQVLYLGSGNERAFTFTPVWLSMHVSSRDQHPIFSEVARGRGGVLTDGQFDGRLAAGTCGVQRAPLQSTSGGPRQGSTMSSSGHAQIPMTRRTFESRRCASIKRCAHLALTFLQWVPKSSSRA